MNIVAGYFTEDWEKIAATLPAGADLKATRSALEDAALAFTLTPTLRRAGFPELDYEEARDLAQKLQLMLAYDFIDRKFSVLIQELEKFIEIMDGMAMVRDRHTHEERRRMINPRPQDIAKLTYYDAVFAVWTAAGGQLRTSRHPLTGAVTGPLVRFFLAAVRPVMGQDTPREATIKGIVAKARERAEARA